MFIDPSILEIPLELNNSNIEDVGLSLKIATLVLFVIVFIGIYCFYLF